MAFLQWNCRSFITKIDVFKKFLLENKTDVILLQETWLLPNQSPFIKDFRLISQPSLSGYQGIAFLVSNGIYFEQIAPLNLLQVEMLAIKIKLGSKFFHIFNIYIHHSITLNNLKEDIQTILDFASTKENVILGGDFNAHHESWGNTHEDSRGTLIAQLFLNYNLCILNTGEATKIQSPGQRKSAIDITLCSPVFLMDFQWKVLEENLGSDHYLISFVYLGDSRNINRISNKKIYVDKNKFKYHLNQIDPDEYNDFSNFHSEIKKCIKKSTKSIHFYQSDPSDYWSEETKKAYAIRTQALRDFNSDHTKYSEYSKAEATFKNIRRRHKKRDKRTQIESKLTANASSTELWQITQRISGKNIKSRRNLICENEEQAVAFLDKYFPNNEESLHPPQCFTSNIEILDTNLTKEFTWDEFSQFLSSRKRRSAPGHDGLSYDLILELPFNLKIKFLNSMNTLWNNNDIPNKLLTVKVIPIPKIGKPDNTVDSYRPISLISSTLKIINGMLKNRMQLFATNTGLLEENSFGFQKGVSTSTCLNVLTNDIFSSIRQNDHVILVFIDLSSAFDKVILDILENLLLNSFPKKCVNWIMSFLKERTIFTKSEGIKIYRKINRGLAQGDILSPFLFNFYTKIIHTLSDQYTKIYQYADDFVILSKGATKRVNMANMQFKLDQLSQICKNIGMQINISKSAFMVIRDEDLEGIISLKIDTIQLERKNVIKYLGILFDEDLTFKCHVKQLHQDINGRLNIMKFISGFSWGAHPKTLTTVYKGIIRSKLDYGCSVYSICTNTSLKKLDSINNAALRIVTGLTRTTPLNVLSAISAEPPLHIRRDSIIKKEIIKSTYYNNTLGKQLTSLDITLLQNITNQRNLAPMERKTCSLNSLFQNLDTRPPTIPVLPLNLEIHTNLLVSSKHNFSNEVINQIVQVELNKYKNCTIIYTDASITNNKTGIGIFCSEDGSTLDFALNLNLSSTSAELIAIKIAIENSLLLGKNRILLCTDSLGACQRILQELTPTNNVKNYSDKLVNDILKLSCEYQYCSIIIKWIPGHTNIYGNEIADKLAKLGCNSNHFLPVKYQLLDALNQIQSSNMDVWKDWFINLAQEKGKYYFKIRPIVDNKPWYYKFKFKNNDTKTLNRLLAGHTYTKKWLNIMRIERNNICDKCPGKIEDENHIISECIKYDKQRRSHQLLLKYSVEQILKKNNPKELKEICNFLNETDLKI
jgi:ribonuclease HI